MLFAEQVVYFHNPDYERRRQERQKVASVSTGADCMEGVQMIPCIMQLHPDIPVEVEDAHNLLDSKTKWKWIFMGKIVYLRDPAGKLLFHSNVAVLLKHYRSMSQHACLSE
jgi:hypothetical protein